MIKDYAKYEMSQREKLIFSSAGYGVIAFMAFLYYHSIIMSILAGAAVLWLKPLYEDYMVHKRMRRLNIQFKDLLYSLSASIASGRQMSEAIVEANDSLSLMYSSDTEIMTELAHMSKSIIENNESDAVLLEDFAQRTHNEDIGNFVQVYLTCRNLGGDLEKIIQRTAGIINDKMAIQREIEALTAQKKLEGRMIALMPPLMLLLLNIASPSYIAPMYETFTGRIIMTACLGATFWGIWMMEKLSSADI